MDHRLFTIFTRNTHIEHETCQGGIFRKPRIGEVVIIKEDGVPRGNWKLAKVKTLIQSDIDGIYRAATLVTSSGKILKRPLRLLYPLEGSNDDTHSLNEKSNVDNLIKPYERRAATIARKKVRGIKQ